MIFKKLTTLKSNETKEVEAVQLWEVRWRSRHGEFHSDTKPQLECFTSKELAEDFAQSLKIAFKLIRHIGSDKISVRKVD